MTDKQITLKQVEHNTTIFLMFRTLGLDRYNAKEMLGRNNHINTQYTIMSLKTDKFFLIEQSYNNVVYLKSYRGSQNVTKKSFENFGLYRKMTRANVKENLWLTVLCWFTKPFGRLILSYQKHLDARTFG